MIHFQHSRSRICAILLLSWGLAGCQPDPPAPAAAATTPEGLVAELRSDDANVRSRAGQTLIGHGASAQAPLLTVLADTSSLPESRLYAIDCLSKIGTKVPEVRSAFFSALRDPSEEVRQQAVRCLIDSNPPLKLTTDELKSLVVGVPADVVREIGAFLWAGKVSTSATPKDLGDILLTLCKATDWSSGSPAVSLGLISLLQQSTTELPPDLTVLLLEALARVSDHVPEPRKSQLSARLSEVTAGLWLISGGVTTTAPASVPPGSASPSVPASPLIPPDSTPSPMPPGTVPVPNAGATPAASSTASASPDRFPVSDAERSEQQTIELACELTRLILKSGHLNEEQFRDQFRRPRNDPLRLLAERESIRLGASVMVSGYVDALEVSDHAGQRDAAAALAAIQPAKALAPVTNRVAAIASLHLEKDAGRDVDYSRSLLQLLSRLGKVPPNVGPVLARLVSHSDPRLSEAALAALGTMADPPKIDVQLSPPLLRLIDDDVSQPTARTWAMQQLERQIPNNGATPRSVRCIFEKMANHREDPLRNDAIKFLKARQFPDAGQCLLRMREQIAIKFPDVWVQHLAFVPNGQVKITGWCSRPESVEACQQTIEELLQKHALLEWAAWRNTEAGDSGKGTEPSAIEIELVTPDFQSVLQQSILKHPDLQGCGVFASKITANGDLMLSGLVAQSSQKPQLQQLAAQLLNEPDWKKRLPGRTEWSKLVTIPSEDLLDKLRLWSEQKKLELWTDRLTLDASGRVLITGWCSAEGGLPDRLRQQMFEFLKTHPLGKFFQEQGLSAGVTVATKFEPLKPDFGSLLRTIAENSPKPSGVSIETVYFTAQGKLMVEGAQESSEALAAFKPQLLAELQKPELQRLLPSGVDFAPFRVQRTEDLIALLKDALPVHPECDGVRITGGRRGPKGELVFSGEATVLLTNPRIGHLTAALSQVTGGAKQVAAGVTFADVKVITRSQTAADRNLQTALSQLGAKKNSGALEPLQNAVLHAPDSSTIWFLWGVYYLAVDDTPRARRMLYRAALLEQNNSDRVSARLGRLESYQGPVFRPLRTKATELQNEIAAHLDDADWLHKELKVTRLPEGPARSRNK